VGKTLKERKRQPLLLEEALYLMLKVKVSTRGSGKKGEASSAVRLPGKGRSHRPHGRTIKAKPAPGEKDVGKNRRLLALGRLDETIKGKEIYLRRRGGRGKKISKKRGGGGECSSTNPEKALRARGMVSGKKASCATLQKKKRGGGVLGGRKEGGATESC